MTDVMSLEQRSYNMSRIRAKNTKPEVLLRKSLYLHGIRGFRIHYPLFGKPDIVFVKKRLAVFIDGCFWHRCPRCFIMPEKRTRFWRRKISENVKRDKNVGIFLRKHGWKVLRFWEHTIKDNTTNCILKILSTCKTKKNY